MSFPNVFRRTICLNNLGELLDDLLGLGITIVDEILKYNSQWPNSIHVFAIATTFLKYVLSLRIILRCFHNSLSRPGVDELLHLSKELANSSSAKCVQDKDKNNPNLPRTSQSTG